MMQMGHKSNSINESFPLCISRGVSCTSSMPSPFRMWCMGLPRCRRRGSSCPSPSLSKLPSLHRAFFTFLSQEFFVSVPFFGFGFFVSDSDGTRPVRSASEVSEPVRKNQFRIAQPFKPNLNFFLRFRSKSGRTACARRWRSPSWPRPARPSPSSPAS